MAGGAIEQRAGRGGSGPVLVVLAAGAGSRFGGEKQLEPVGPAGEALLEYTVFDALRAGFGSVVLVVRPGAEARYRRSFAAGMARALPVHYVQQRLDDVPPARAAPSGRQRPWGTGHAVLAASAALDAPFAVANADDLYGAAAFEQVAGFLRRLDPKAAPPTLGAAVAFEVGETLSEAGGVSRAWCRAEADGTLREIRELEGLCRRGERVRGVDAEGCEHELDASEPVSMNLWGFDPRFVAELRRGFDALLERLSACGPEERARLELRLPDVVAALLHDRSARFELLRSPGPWCGLTFRGDVSAVRARLAQQVAAGRYPASLWSGSGA